MTSEATRATGRPWLNPADALRRGHQSGRLSPRSQSGAGGELPRYGFRLGPLRLLAGTDVLVEVLHAAPVYPLPGAPRWLAGLINLRGNLAPVLDLHHFCGFNVSKADCRDLLALDRAPDTVCLYVDGLPERVSIEGEARRPPALPASLRDHVGRALRGDGAVWMEFGHTGFFRSLAAGNFS